MLLQGLEPVLYAPEDVTIAGIKESLRDPCALDEPPETDTPTKFAEVPVDFRLLPMLNRDEYLLHERNTYSMITNKALNCGWHHYVQNISKWKITPLLKLPPTGEFKFRRNTLRLETEYRKHNCMTLTYEPRIINGVMSLRVTAPKPIKRKIAKKANEQPNVCENEYPGNKGAAVQKRKK